MFKKAMLEFLLIYSGVKANYMVLCTNPMHIRKTFPVCYNINTTFNDFEDLNDWLVEN